MPGYLLNVFSQVQCMHGGIATPTVSNPRVLVNGQPTVLMSTPYQVAGCAMPPPSAGNGPCVTGQWTSGTVRVTSLGQPLLVQPGTSTCVPTGTPLVVMATQPRVSAM
nr:hypothetical protein [uncultured Desulfobacter sp.]